MYNFDEIIDRRHTDCLKYRALKERWKREDLLPLWVADMDFRTPPFIVDALKKRLEHEIYGYTSIDVHWHDSIIQWLEARQHWKIEKEQLTFVPGIVRGIAFALQCFTEPGDKILVQPPVYHPFFLTVAHNHREVVWNPLKLSDGQFHIDFERFEKDVQGCKLFILSNPHNPGGRVWTREELERIADICWQSHTLVISDEIHADLTLPPYQHIPFASVSDKARMNSIVFGAPTKAFNIPGIVTSYAVIQHPSIYRQYTSYLKASELDEGNMLAYIAQVAAYSHGTEWLDAVKAYILQNIDFTEHFLRQEMPQIQIIRPQASYLIFLDCRALNLTQPELVRLFVEDAHLALNDGCTFGREGTGFMRLNVATPRFILRQALTQLRDALAQRC